MTVNCRYLNWIKSTKNASIMQHTGRPKENATRCSIKYIWDDIKLYHNLRVYHLVQYYRQTMITEVFKTFIQYWT